LPDLGQTVNLEKEIRGKLAAIAEQGRGELDSYKVALSAHAPGYIHLQNARKFSAEVSEIDSSFPAGQALAGDVMQASNGFESVLRSAESSVAEKQMDKAIGSLTPIRAFAGRGGDRRGLQLLLSVGPAVIRDRRLGERHQAL
jgi:hypothetical protein